MTAPAPATNGFTALLTTFADAVQANDGQRLATLFSSDGVYEDGFFGAHTGKAAIAAMLQRFHETGTNYLWEFFDPVSDGARVTPAFASATLRASRKAWDDRFCSRGSAVSGFAAN
jgi:limonene-1,2-epoxide hydrolase